MINKIDFKAKNLTSNAGLLLLFNHAKSEGVFDLLENEITFADKGIDKIKMNHIKTLLCGNFIGIDKLERIKLLQSDPLVKEFGIDIKEPETVSRFLGKFSFMTTQMIRNANFKLFKKLLDKSRLKNITIDIDSTVINVEGYQEGTAKGYNPEKPGNRCYNTLMAFCDELKAFISGFTRSGNTYTANGAAEMITEIIENLRDSVDTITFRMDSGYFDENIIKTIEGADCCYIIKAKQYGNMLDKLYRGDSLQWVEYDISKEISEIRMRPDKWERPRRFVVVRRLKPEEERKQLSLIGGDDYEYAFYVTNTTFSNEATARGYEKRGNCENYIKESKYDMNVGSLLLKSFWANEAVFQLMMLAYNLFLLFKFDRLVAQEYRQQIKTFRLKYLFVAGRIIRTARSTMLKLAFDYPYKEVFQRCAL